MGISSHVTMPSAKAGGKAKPLKAKKKGKVDPNFCDSDDDAAMKKNKSQEMKASRRWNQEVCWQEINPTLRPTRNRRRPYLSNRALITSINRRHDTLRPTMHTDLLVAKSSLPVLSRQQDCSVLGG